METVAHLAPLISLSRILQHHNKHEGHQTPPTRHMLFTDLYTGFLEIILTDSWPWEIGFYPKMEEKQNTSFKISPLK